MTKVAQDYRSAPERSSHPLLPPQGSDFSRWWEQEPEKTLAGLGPFAESENAEDGSDFPELYLADAADDDDDDDANEPTRLLARSLLQMPPRIGPESEDEAGPLQASGSGPAESMVLRKAAAVEAPAAESPSAAPAIAALDTNALDECARRVSHDSVLRKWIAHSSPQAAAPSSLVPSKVALAEALPGVPPTPTPQPLWRTVTRRVGVLPRTPVTAVVAGVAAVLVLVLLLLSRLGGAKASAGQFAPQPAVPAVPRPPAAQAPPARPAASGETEKDVLVELAPHKLLPVLPSPRGVSAPIAALPASKPLAAATPVPQAKSPGETLVHIKADAKPLAAGSAGLRLNSIPLSTVIVDGRSQGLTPRLLQVTPGVHSVVFVHSDLGRRLVSVDVAGGTTAVAAVKF